MSNFTHFTSDSLLLLWKMIYLLSLIPTSKQALYSNQFSKITIDPISFFLFFHLQTHILSMLTLCWTDFFHEKKKNSWILLYFCLHTLVFISIYQRVIVRKYLATNEKKSLMYDVFLILSWVRSVIRFIRSSWTEILSRRSSIHNLTFTVHQHIRFSNVAQFRRFTFATV